MGRGVRGVAGGDPQSATSTHQQHRHKRQDLVLLRVERRRVGQALDEGDADDGEEDHFGDDDGEDGSQGEFGEVLGDLQTGEGGAEEDEGLERETEAISKRGEVSRGGKEGEPRSAPRVWRRERSERLTPGTQMAPMKIVVYQSSHKSRKPSAFFLLGSRHLLSISKTTRLTSCTKANAGLPSGAIRIFVPLHPSTPGTNSALIGGMSAMISAKTREMVMGETIDIAAARMPERIVTGPAFSAGVGRAGEGKVGGRVVVGKGEGEGDREEGGGGRRWVTEEVDDLVLGKREVGRVASGDGGGGDDLSLGLVVSTASTFAADV